MSLACCQASAWLSVPPKSGTDTVCGSFSIQPPSHDQRRQETGQSFEFFPKYEKQVIMTICILCIYEIQYRKEQRISNLITTIFSAD